MSGIAEIAVCTLHVPVAPEALGALRKEVAAAIEGGAREIVVDIDHVGVLESPVISTLISILREAREHGAKVSLRASRQSILDTLRITALDKVFTIVSSQSTEAPQSGAPSNERIRGGARAAADVPPAKRKRSAVKSGPFVALWAALAIGLFALGSGRLAAADPSAEDLVDSVVASNAAVASYQADVSIQLHLRSFPFISQHLEGTTYYKRPDNFEVVFRHVPGYAHGFDRLYADIDDPSSWTSRFVLSLAGQKIVDGHVDTVVRLVQKVRGMIDHEDVAIDPGLRRIDAMEWHYYNGGVITMTQDFEGVAGGTLLAHQHAEIRIPFVRAVADAVYSDYKTNVAIDDSVFTRAAR